MKGENWVQSIGEKKEGELVRRERKKEKRKEREREREREMGLNQAAKFKNLTLLAKLNWRLNQEKESIWAKVILRKYCSVDKMRARDPDKLPCSLNWRAIKASF